MDRSVLTQLGEAEDRIKEFNERIEQRAETLGVQLKQPTEVSKAEQTMWEALGIMGYDLDGDETPGALIAGMGREGFYNLFLEHVKETAQELDDLYDQINDY